MKTRAAGEPDFHDMVRDLTRTHEHREPYEGELGRWVGEGTSQERWVTRTTWSASHVSRVPALVYQLLGAAPASAKDLSGAGPQSRPAARIEALDTVMLIDDEAGEWLNRLGEVIPADRIDPTSQLHVRGSGTVAALRKLGSLHRRLRWCKARAATPPRKLPTCCPRHRLEYDVRHWWHQARIITGWDSPAIKPHNTCPVCEQWDSLRIRIDVQLGVIDVALCVECRSLWEGSDQIGILAEHIRAENHDELAGGSACES